MASNVYVDQRATFPQGLYFLGVAPDVQYGSQAQRMEKETGVPVWKLSFLDPAAPVGAAQVVTAKCALALKPELPQMTAVLLQSLRAIPWARKGGGQNGEASGEIAFRCDDVKPANAK